MDGFSVCLRARSDLRELALRVGVAKYSKGEETEVLIFHTVNQLWDFVERKLLTDKCILIIGHNIQFDLHVLKAYNILKNRGYTADGIVIADNDDKIFLNRWIKEDRIIYAFDNMQVYNCSVKKIGEKFGIVKPVIYDYDNATLNEITNRCIIDVEIVMKRASKISDILRKMLGKDSKITVTTTSSLEQNIKKNLSWRDKKQNVMPCGLDVKYASEKHVSCAYPTCFNCTTVSGDDVKCCV